MMIYLFVTRRGKTEDILREEARGILDAAQYTDNRNQMAWLEASCRWTHLAEVRVCARAQATGGFTGGVSFERQ